MRRTILFVMLLTHLSGCGREERAPGAPVAQAAPSPAPASSAATPPAQGRAVSIDDKMIAFEYSYPAAAAAIPALRKQLDAELEKNRAELVDAAEEGREQARAGGWDYHPYGRWIAWQVVTELPDWLSLSATVGTYEGGAHPNHGFDSLVWDKRAQRRRQPLDLFSSNAALSGAIRKPFCAALDRQRVKRRGEPLRPHDPFSECIDPVESTIILGSSDRRSFDRIGVLVAPYAAGPYAEGDYEITLPVTASVLAAVRPEYRRFFAARR